MLSTLYQSQLLEISRFDCPGHDSRDEEVSMQHEIVVPLHGVFLRRDSFGELVGDSNHILFFNAHQPHEIRHPAGVGETALLIHLENSQLLEMLLDNAPHLENHHDRPFERASLRLDTGQQWEKFQTLSALPGAEPMAVEETWLHWLNQIFVMLHDRHEDTRPLNAQQREAVHAVQIYLNQNFCHALTLADISAHVHYSPFMLCNLFKRAFGSTIHQYLTELRLTLALKRLLEEPEQAVGSLGMALGYNSPSHFSTAFANAFGFPPTTARTRLNRGVQDYESN